MFLEFLSKELEAWLSSIKLHFYGRVCRSMWERQTRSQPLGPYWRLISSVGPMIECCLAQGVKVNGKALEWRTILAVSAWPAPLSPLGFSASDPIRGLSHWLACALPCRPWEGCIMLCQASFTILNLVESLTLSFFMSSGSGWGIFVGYARTCLRVASWWSADILLAVWGLCFGKALLTGPQ
jgi:hypothetical protein